MSKTYHLFQTKLKLDFALKITRVFKSMNSKIEQTEMDPFYFNLKTC